MPQPSPIQERPRPITVPNVYIPLLEQLGIRLPRDEPEELLDYAAPEDAFCCQEGQAVVAQVELEGLRGKEGERARARAVCSGLAGVQDSGDEREVLVFFVRLRA